MRLRRIALTDVAGVASSELVVREQGVSVVLAPNETGKSTLLRAYRLLLDPKVAHNAKRADVKALQPVGRDVGSTIEAELVIGDDTFHVLRTYNRQVRSELTVTGRSTVTVTGKEADDLLRSRFLAAVDLDLFELLHLAQGRALDAPAAASSTTVVSALTARGLATQDGADGPDGPDGADGAAAVGPDGDAVIEALRRRVRAAFHATTGRPIGELRKQEQAVDAAEHERDELAQRIAALTGGGDTDAHAAELAELTAELADVDVRIRRAERAARTRTARRLRDAAVDRVRQREQQVEALEAADADLAERTAQVDATRADVAEREAAIGALTARADAAAAERATLVATAAQAEADLLAALDAAVASLEARLAEEPVDRALVERAQRLERDVDVARAATQAGAWQLDVHAGRDLDLDVDGEAAPLPSGADLSRPVAASLVVRDADGTVIELRGDADRQGALARLAEATAALAELLSGAGADDVAALAARLAVRDEVAAEAARVGARASALRATPVADPLPAPSGTGAGAGAAGADGADIAALEAAHEAACAALDAQGDADAAELEAARAALAQRTALAEQQETELARSTQRRDAAALALTEARAERDDAALAEEVVAAQAALDTLATADADGDGDEGEDDDALDDVEDAELLAAVRERIVERIDGVRHEAALAEGRRSSAGALAATLTHLEEKAATLAAEHARDLREAEAARTLLGRLEDARAEQGDRYREPLEERLGELMSELYGYACRVELDDDLRIARRSEPDGAMVPFDLLSGGAKEQAAVLTGLAIAELAGDGGVPLWIDDAIVFSDDDRVEALKGILAATTAQVIVLTCRSELADGLHPAEFHNGG